MKWKPSQVWCACEIARIPCHERNRIVYNYIERDELPYKVEKVIRDWSKLEE